ncbi:ras family-domain-containing protein [Globomyces pollinis-pini]|nr:ras family-domain-containing protein [Globomyces pollinis-pini]
MSKYDYLLKYISVGDSGVGKSCLLLRLTNKEFTPTETTIGIEFGSTVIDLHDKQIKLQIWDTAGQESFRSISRAYYRGAIGCLLVFDVTRRDTFLHLLSWLEDVKQHGNDHIKTIVVANKCDLAHKRQVTREEGEAFAEKNGLLYLEASAKTGLNVEEAFTSLASTIFHSLNLSRDISQCSDAELKALEQNGVKVGPRKPLVLVTPTTNSVGGGCC